MRPVGVPRFWAPYGNSMCGGFNVRTRSAIKLDPLSLRQDAINHADAERLVVRAARAPAAFANRFAQPPCRQVCAWVRRPRRSTVPPRPSPRSGAHPRRDRLDHGRDARRSVCRKLRTHRGLRHACDPSHPCGEGVGRGSVFEPLARRAVQLVAELCERAIGRVGDWRLGGQLPANAAVRVLDRASLVRRLTGPRKRSGHDGVDEIAVRRFLGPVALDETLVGIA